MLDYFSVQSEISAPLLDHIRQAFNLPTPFALITTFLYTEFPLFLNASSLLFHTHFSAYSCWENQCIVGWMLPRIRRRPPEKSGISHRSEYSYTQSLVLRLQSLFREKELGYWLLLSAMLFLLLLQETYQMYQ